MHSLTVMDISPPLSGDARGIEADLRDPTRYIVADRYAVYLVYPNGTSVVIAGE